MQVTDDHVSCGFLSDKIFLVIRLWCAVQEYKGSRCSDCPSQFISQPSNQLACNLWTELKTLQESGVSVGAALTSVQCPHTGSAICGLWCMIQNYKGRYCGSASTTTTSTTTTTTTTTTATTATTTTTWTSRPVAVIDYSDCPAEYQSSSSAAVLCVMWVELAELEQSVGTIPQNGQGYIPVTCQFSDFESKP